MSVRSGFQLYPSGYPKVMKEMSRNEKSMLVNIFDAADEGRKGYLTRSDIKVAMVELLGYKPTKYEVNQLLQAHGTDIDTHTKGLVLEGFLSCMHGKLACQDEDEEIRHTFMAFDVQCRGFLTLEDVKKVFSKVAPHVSAPTVHSAFREIDQDGDGRVSYKDFEFLMKYSLSDHI